MNETDCILIETLGRVDAAFAPQRVWEPRRLGTNVFEARCEYPKSGVPWRGGAAGAAQVAAARALAELEGAGLVVLRKSAVRTTHVRMTDAGEARGRALCGLSSLRASHALAQRVAAYATAPDYPDHLEEYPRGAWETWLAGIEWKATAKKAARQKLIAIEETALPALLRGWLESNSTGHGQVHYVVTAMWAEVADMEFEPEPAEGLEYAGDEGRHLYYEMFRGTRESLARKSPVWPGKIGQIPLVDCSGGYGGLRYRPKLK